MVRGRAGYPRGVQLILIRHGRPERIDHDPDGADPALTELGHRQAAAMAEFLADQELSAIYTSPQLRAIETAQPLVASKGLEPTIVPGIAEFDHGHTSYVPGEEMGPITDAELEELIARATANEFIERVRAATTSIIDAHPGETVAAVCHGGVISIILNDILGTPIETYYDSKYTSVTRVSASREGRRSMSSFNECHWIRDLS